MKPTATIIVGDALAMLRTLPDASVHCCWTSPPYWGLRDYGTATWEGGSAECDHQELRGGTGESSAKQVTSAGASTTYQYRAVCRKCGARRIDAQLGLEPTPEEYVAGMVAVFREVRRVMRPDGTLWLNVGDSYAGSGVGGQATEADTRHATVGALLSLSQHRLGAVNGLKPKDLVGIPWRVAFALQADGWYLRQDIIWHKPNPMPESVTDRCTKAHEYLFLLAKSARYYYDAEAVKEPCESGPSDVRKMMEGLDRIDAKHFHVDPGPMPAANHRTNIGNKRAVGDPYGRNRRSVWTIATEPSSLPHFAMAPTALVRPCILAGCPAGGTVLDPFAGAGTTGVVAMRECRNFIGVELNPQYAEYARARCARYWDRDKRPVHDGQDARQPALLEVP